MQLIKGKDPVATLLRLASLSYHVDGLVLLDAHCAASRSEVTRCAIHDARYVIQAASANCLPTRALICSAT